MKWFLEADSLLVEADENDESITSNVFVDFGLLFFLDEFVEEAIEVVAFAEVAVELSSICGWSDTEE